MDYQLAAETKMPDNGKTTLFITGTPRDMNKVRGHQMTQHAAPPAAITIQAQAGSLEYGNAKFKTHTHTHTQFYTVLHKNW